MSDEEEEGDLFGSAPPKQKEPYVILSPFSTVYLVIFARWKCSQFREINLISLKSALFFL